jgi:hypothetical protein
MVRHGQGARFGGVFSVNQEGNLPGTTTSTRWGVEAIRATTRIAIDEECQPMRSKNLPAHGTDPLFSLGTVVATPGALIALVRAYQDVGVLLARHEHGDWGAMNAADAEGNDAAVGDGGRILSVYRLPDGTTLWIMTEADRSLTRLLLPEED